MTAAIDIAILPSPEVSALAIALSAALPGDERQGLVLGADCLPHITLTQQFVPEETMDAFFRAVDRVLRGHPPLHLRVTGGGKGDSSVWMSIARTPQLVALHERLLYATRPFEAAAGDASAFWGGEARERDITWVREFRKKSSFDRFTPHITLGHASEPPVVQPMEFVATEIAACDLGRFCACRRVRRRWML